MTVDLATENVLKGGDATDGLANRQKVVEAAMPGAVLLQASKVLEDGLPPVEDAPLVMVYHNATTSAATPATPRARSSPPARTPSPRWRR